MSNFTFWAARVGGRYVDGAAVSDASVLDLLLLAHADALVAGFGSHFGRLAFELSVALKGARPRPAPRASADRLCSLLA